MKTSEEILHQLGVNGERVTIQRRAVIEALCARIDHQSIQTLQQRIRADQALELSETTIYRILEWLKRTGIVSQTDMGTSGIVYCLIDTPRHHHLICLSCGAVINVADHYFDALRQHLRAEFGFAPRIDHMAIYGLCEQCAQTDDQIAPSHH